MTELKYVKEYLGTGIGTEGSLLIPRKIYDTIIMEYDKALLPSEVIALYAGPGQIPGSSIDINLQDVNTSAVRLTPEGSEVFLDQPSFSNLNLKPDKYGIAIRITREMLEDAQWNLLDFSIKLAGRRFAENVTSKIISDSLDSAANTVSGGAAVTIANITRAIQYLNDADATPTDFIIGMEVLNDLQNIDTFVEYQKVGNTEMLQRGFLGTIYGMNVIKVSTNAGMTTTSAYVIDRKYAIAFAEKRPVSLEKFELPTQDMSGAVITQRFKTKALRSTAIAKITSS